VKIIDPDKVHTLPPKKSGTQEKDKINKVINTIWTFIEEGIPFQMKITNLPPRKQRD